MMEEEEETLFDQEGLLGGGREDSGVSERETKQWKRKLLKTTALSMSFFCLGLCISIPGPTLMDLGQRVGKDTEHMALIFTGRSLGYLLGACVGGVLFDFFDQQLLLLYTLAATGVATIFVPWCTALSVLSLTIGVQGMAMGVLDTGGNVFCIKIWGKQSAPYMQVLHFCFGIGAFLAPLLARPFLNDYFISLSNSSSIVDYHPVNTKLHTLSAALSQDKGRVLRDLSHLDPLFNYIGPAESWPLDLRARRDANVSESTADEALSGIGNNQSWSGNSTDNVNNTDSSQQIWSSTTPRPRKPPVIEGGALSKDHADSDKVNDQLKDLKDNPVVHPQQDVPTPPPPVVVSTTIVEQESNLSNGTDMADNNNTSSDVSPPLDIDQKDVTGDQNGTSSSSTSTSTTATTTTTTTTTTTPSTTTPTTTPPPATTTTTTTTASSTAPTTNPLPNTSASSLEKPSETSDSTNSSVTSSNSTSLDSWGGLAKYMLHKLETMSRIQFAYLIIGLLLLINSVGYMILYCKDKTNSHPLYTVAQEDLMRPPDPRWYVASILSLLFFFFLIYVGMEVSFGGLITTFAVEYPNIIWTQAQGATLAAIFWGSIAMGRGFAIFLARCFKPPCMMVTNLVLTLAGSLILCFGIFASSALLWVGTVVIGLGMSSVFPSAVSWADLYYPLTGKATAIFIAGSGIGEMTLPILTGVLYEKLSPMALMYSTLVLACLLALVFSSMQVVACRKRSPQRSHSGFMRLETSEDMADDMDMGLMDGSGLTVGMRRRKEEAGAGQKQEEEEVAKLVELSD